MDYLEFIDSAQVRAYNRYHTFTPMEQAVIVYHSKLQPLQRKLEAWKMLLDRYTEEDFDAAGSRMLYGKGGYRMVSDLVKGYEAALQKMDEPTEMFFAIGLRMEDDPWLCGRSFHVDFDQAYRQLPKMRERYEETSRTDPFRAEIWRFDPCQSDRNDMTCEYNTDLELIDISRAECDPAKQSMDQLFMLPRLPFRKGDMLKTIATAKPSYGVLQQDVDVMHYADVWEDGDRRDMALEVTSYEDTLEGYRFEQQSFGFWQVERCDPEDLPEEYRNLQMLSEVYAGTVDPGEMLCACDAFEEYAWRMVERCEPSDCAEDEMEEQELKECFRTLREMFDQREAEDITSEEENVQMTAEMMEEKDMSIERAYLEQTRALCKQGVLHEGEVLDRAAERYFAEDSKREFFIVEGILLRHNHQFGGDVQIPDGVRIISDVAFAGESGIESVTVPESVEKIGFASFGHCSHLKKLVFMGKPQVDEEAFDGCIALTEIHVPYDGKELGLWIYRSITAAQEEASFRQPDEDEMRKIVLTMSCGLKEEEPSLEQELLQYV